jgi:hypothetical protein
MKSFYLKRTSPDQSLAVMTNGLTRRCMIGCSVVSAMSTTRKPSKLAVSCVGYEHSL